MDARAVFALFVVLIVMPIVTIWVFYRLYKIERLKTRQQRLQDLKQFGWLLFGWLVITSALELALRFVLQVDLVSAGGLPGALLLAAVSLLWFEPAERTKAVIVVSGSLLAVVVHAALNLLR